MKPNGRRDRGAVRTMTRHDFFASGILDKYAPVRRSSERGSPLVFRKGQRPARSKSPAPIVVRVQAPPHSPEVPRERVREKERIVEKLRTVDRERIVEKERVIVRHVIVVREADRIVREQRLLRDRAVTPLKAREPSGDDRAEAERQAAPAPAPAGHRRKADGKQEGNAREDAPSGQPNRGRGRKKAKQPEGERSGPGIAEVGEDAGGAPETGPVRKGGRPGASDRTGSGTERNAGNNRKAATASEELAASAADRPFALPDSSEPEEEPRTSKGTWVRANAPGTDGRRSYALRRLSAEATAAGRSKDAPLAKPSAPLRLIDRLQRRGKGAGSLRSNVPDADYRERSEGRGNRASRSVSEPADRTPRLATAAETRRPVAGQGQAVTAGSGSGEGSGAVPSRRIALSDRSASDGGMSYHQAGGPRRASDGGAASGSSPGENRGPDEGQAFHSRLSAAAALGPDTRLAFARWLNRRRQKIGTPSMPSLAKMQEAASGSKAGGAHSRGKTRLSLKPSPTASAEQAQGGDTDERRTAPERAMPAIPDAHGAGGWSGPLQAHRLPAKRRASEAAGADRPEPAAGPSGEPPGNRRSPGRALSTDSPESAGQVRNEAQDGAGIARDEEIGASGDSSGKSTDSDGEGRLARGVFETSGSSEATRYPNLTGFARGERSSKASDARPESQGTARERADAGVRPGGSRQQAVTARSRPTPKASQQDQEPRLGSAPSAPASKPPIGAAGLAGIVRARIAAPRMRLLRTQANPPGRPAPAAPATPAARRPAGGRASETAEASGAAREMEAPSRIGRFIRRSGISPSPEADLSRGVSDLRKPGNDGRTETRPAHVPRSIGRTGPSAPQPAGASRAVRPRLATPQPVAGPSALGGARLETLRTANAPRASDRGSRPAPPQDHARQAPGGFGRAMARETEGPHAADRAGSPSSLADDVARRPALVRRDATLPPLSMAASGSRRAPGKRSTAEAVAVAVAAPVPAASAAAAPATLEMRRQERPAPASAQPRPVVVESPRAIDETQLKAALSGMPELRPEKLADEVYKALMKRIKFEQRTRGY